MEDQIFTNGRYRNRTFGYVFENDPIFCEQVMNSAKASRYEEFRKFLVSKLGGSSEEGPRRSTLPRICEEAPLYFANSLPTSLAAELDRIIGEPIMKEKNVHSRCISSRRNSFVTILYHFFVEKMVYNLRDEEAFSEYIETYAAVFPFKVSARISLRSLPPVLFLFDEEFKSRIQSFLDCHFDDVKFPNIVPLLLSNIRVFQEENFSESEVDDLQLMGNGKSNSYLTDFPRLNLAGAARLRNLHSVYEQVMEIYGRQPGKFRTEDRDLLCLPERNFRELFLLLNGVVFQRQRERYTKLFEKYLFFFVRALAAEDNPVFFIDDLLFECLKSLRTYKTSRGVLLDMLFELSMMSLVYLRKTRTVAKKYGSDVYEVNRENLLEMQNYIQNIPGIENAVINLQVDSDCLRFPIFLCTSDTCYDLSFSHGACSVRSVQESVLMAALCPRKIKHFVVYNPFLGKECCMDVPCSDICEEVHDFVRRYNTWDFSRKISRNKLLTRGLNQFFAKL